MTESLTTFDSADHLDSDQAVANFLSAALETSVPAHVVHTLGVVARAGGMTDVFNRASLSREQLHRSFSAEGNPALAVMEAPGILLSARQGKVNSR